MLIPQQRICKNFSENDSSVIFHLEYDITQKAVQLSEKNIMGNYLNDQ